MSDTLSEALQRTREQLAARFGEQITFAEPFRGELTALVPLDAVTAVLTWLRDEPELAYRLLSDVTAVDRLPREPRFDLVYHVFSLSLGARLRVKAAVAEGQAAPTVTGVWSGANFMEREVYDLFGIPFAGHPNLARILTPEGFTGHPLRRDYALGNEPVDFDIPHRKRFSDALL